MSVSLGEEVNSDEKLGILCEFDLEIVVMWNYEHETTEIDDRYLRLYIYEDYFHDSSVMQLYF